VKQTMIIAICLGVFGFAGGAYANQAGLIGSAQIKDRSIRLVDLNPSAVRALRGKAGAQGPAGAFDPTRISAVRGEYTFIGSGQEKQARASCPAGSVLIGGGAYSPDTAPLTVSGPVLETATSTTATGWFASAVNNGGLTTALQAVAMCAAG
jgi:hypothetical protein